MLVGDRFLKKCPTCEGLLEKQDLHVGHTCVCGYVWEGFVANEKQQGLFQNLKNA